MTDAAPIGQCNDFIGLQRIVRLRKDQLQISNITLSELTGLPDGLTNKLLTDPPYAKMGVMSFGLLLQALGLKLIVVEDVETMARFASQLVKRQEKQVRKTDIRAKGMAG